MRRHGGFWIACVVLACAPAVGRADSVWSERSACLISDNKAFRLGDVVTISVQEDDTVTHSVANSLSKVTSTQGSISAVDVPSLVSGNVTSLLKGTLTPQVQYGSTRTLDGKGSYNLQGTITTQITAVVMDVLPNGNLVIEGSHLRKSVDEKVLIRISGIIRPEDISNTNVVLSSAVAEAKIVYESDGPIANSNRWGWFEKFVDHIWPF
ncbi:MAG: flagellar basal body L-ring protein FlgH [Candidatus Brocadiia bacterium]